MKKLLSVLFAMVMVFTIPITSMAYSDKRIRVPYFSDRLSYNMAYGKDFDAMVILNSTSLTSDGLSASGLVGASNGVLFAIDEGDDYAYPNNINYIRELLDGDKSKTVYFIGGDKVIPRNIKSQIINDGYNCITLAGRTRIETSYRVAEEIERLTGNVDEIAITKGFGGEADAISIAYEAVKRKMPVILTNGKTVPFSPSSKGVRTYAIGGSKVLSDSLVKNTKAIRLAGSNRYLTNKKVLEYFGRNKGHRFSVIDGEHYYIALNIACAKDIDPVVLASDNSDKTVFQGAQYVTFYDEVEPASEFMRTACENASYGKAITDGMYKIYKATREYKGNTVFRYNPNTNSYPPYVVPYAKKYAKNYYIYNVYFNEGNPNWSPADYSYLVRKSDGKVFMWWEDSSSPSRV